MPVLTDFALAKYEDGILTVSMTPQVAVGGWDVQFSVVKRLGGEVPLITKSLASGYNNVSGMAVVNSGQGVFSVSLASVDTSGLDFGNFAYSVTRLSSGARTVLSQGYLMLLPN